MKHLYILCIISFIFLIGCGSSKAVTDSTTESIKSEEAKTVPQHKNKRDTDVRIKPNAKTNSFEGSEQRDQRVEKRAE